MDNENIFPINPTHITREILNINEDNLHTAIIQTYNYLISPDIEIRMTKHDFYIRLENAGIYKSVCDKLITRLEFIDHFKHIYTRDYAVFESIENAEIIAIYILGYIFDKFILLYRKTDIILIQNNDDSDEDDFEKMISDNMSIGSDSVVLNQQTEEQLHIIESLKHSNVIVIAVAGSGKTTTSLQIAQSFPDLNILLLTYNAKLKSETREKVKKLQFDNIETHSYHSFCVKYYDHVCYTDKEIYEILHASTPPLTEFEYDIIILDESQDINPTYHSLIRKIYLNNNSTAKLCILGDPRQSIYDFNKADSRFLTHADKCFNWNTFQWIRCKLTQSFRLTHNMSKFINKCVLGEKLITSTKDTDDIPYYVKCDLFNERKNEPFNFVKKYLNMGYHARDIFILGPSVRRSMNSHPSPIHVLANKITKELNDIEIYIPGSDEEKLNEKIYEDKIIFSTFHQAKGLERKVVFVYNFDESYFEFYKKEVRCDKCPNELYVAITRSSEHLILLHHIFNKSLPFLNISKINKYVDLCGGKLKASRRVRVKPYDNFNVNVTDLCRHLPQDIINICLKCFDIINIRENTLIKISSTVRSNMDLIEGVSEITGLAIPIYYEYVRFGKMDIIDTLIANPIDIKCYKTKTPIIDNVLEDDDIIDDIIDDEDTDDNYYTITSVEENIRSKTLSIDELLYIVTLWNAYKTKYLFKLKQIKNYNWLTQDNVDLSVNRMNSLDLSSPEFEKYITIHSETFNRDINGYIDCIDGNNLYEFKCVNKLKDYHYIQLAIYAFMNELIKRGTTKYYIYNILRDRLDEIKFDFKKLKFMMITLMKAKYVIKQKLSDRLFIKKYSV